MSGVRLVVCCSVMLWFFITVSSSSVKSDFVGCAAGIANALTVYLSVPLLPPVLEHASSMGVWSERKRVNTDGSRTGLVRSPYGGAAGGWDALPLTLEPAAPSDQGAHRRIQRFTQCEGMDGW